MESAFDHIFGERFRSFEMMVNRGDPIDLRTLGTFFPPVGDIIGVVNASARQHENIRALHSLLYDYSIIYFYEYLSYLYSNGRLPDNQGVDQLVLERLQEYIEALATLNSRVRHGPNR